MTALVFGVIFLAELPDKTALTGLVLGTRYRASYVFAGIAAAFLLHVALAVAAGSVLTLLPQQIVHALTGVLFLAGVGAWFAGLAIGRIPLGLRNAGAHALRYNAQTNGYLLLLTDRYPFSSPPVEEPEQPPMKVR